MEEEMTTICLGGQLCEVPKSIAKNIFNAILETPPIDYEKNQEEVDQIIAEIREAKEKGTY